MLCVVIMAGGRGERFWPLSRLSYPKQFLPLLDQKESMIERTLARASLLTDPENIFISLRQDLLDTARTVLPDFPESHYIVEPVGRDTAAAMGLASVFVDKKRPGSVLAILPADHVIAPDDVFIRDIGNTALIASSTDCLMTFGIKPSRPDTGYGYIETGELINSKNGTDAFEVRKFTEKPDSSTAAQFLQSGRYLWNAGIFVWKPSVFLAELAKYLPAHFNGLLQVQEMFNKPDYLDQAKSVFMTFDRISVDFGVMEKARNVLCVKAGFEWDDVGSWLALERIGKKNEDGNLILGLTAISDTKDSTILNYSRNRILTVMGLRNAVVINTPDSVLVLDKKSEGDMKKLLKMIQTDETLSDFL